MNLQDVTTLTQQIVAQSMGKEYMTQNGYLTAIPADKLVDVGKDVLNTDATTEKATKALVSLLARREVETGNFNYEDRALKSVKTAILSMLDECSNLRVARKPRLEMKIDKGNISLNVSQMSDGEKCTILG